MKLPITRETAGWATSVTRSQRLAALEPVEDADDDLADLVLVGGDPLRREAGLEERLEAVVLGRVHADEHRPRQLDREDLVDHDDAAEFGGVGLPVAADRVDVVGAWSPTRSPSPAGSSVTSEVQWTGHSPRIRLNSSVRRAVDPVLALEHELVLDVSLSGGDLGLVGHARGILLAGWPVFQDRAVSGAALHRRLRSPLGDRRGAETARLSARRPLPWGGSELARLRLCGGHGPKERSEGIDVPAWASVNLHAWSLVRREGGSHRVRTLKLTLRFSVYSEVSKGGCG